MSEIEKKFKGEQKFKLHVEMSIKNPDTTGDNLPIIFSCENLDIDKLEYAINRIVERHESLRSNYVIENDVLFQIVRKYTPVKIKRLSEPYKGNFSKPFDIEKDSPLRFAVFENTVYADFNHSFIDGFGLGIFFHELNDFYIGKDVKSRISRTEDLIVPDELYKVNAEFYKSYFPKNLNKTVVKYDFEIVNRPDIGPAENIFYNIDDQFMNKIKEAAKLNGVTPNNFTGAAFHLLIAMMARQNVVYVQTNVSSRNMKNFRNIGLYLSSLFMRLIVNQNETLKDFLNQELNETKDILKHQDVKIYDLLSELGYKWNEITDIAFVYQNKMISDIRLGNQICKITPINHTDDSYGIVLSFFARSDGAVLQLNYRSDLFKKDTMNRFIEEYIKLLKIQLDNTDLLISDVFKLMNY